MLQRHQLIKLLLLAAALLCGSATATADVRMHDVVLADSSVLATNSDGELRPFTLQLSAKGHDLLLRLAPSRFNGKVANRNLSKKALTRLYQGDVVGDANSWVRVGLHDGTISGTIYHYGTLFRLETRAHAQAFFLANVTDADKADDQNKNANSSSANTHEFVLIEPASSTDAQPLVEALFGATDKLVFPPTYALSDEHVFKTDNTGKLDKTYRSAIANRDGLGTDVTRAIRIGIVVDSRFDEVHKGRGLARALGIINSVDGIYQSQLGVAIIIEGIRVYDDPLTDPMRDNGDTVDELLANFRAVRMNDNRLPKDLTLVHLFSGHRDPDRMIGLGWISAACRLDGFDISMSTAYPFDTLLTAHEIAHNMGALHDDDEQCLADVDRRPDTIMWPETTGNSKSIFSACSVRAIQDSKYASCNLDDIDASVRLSTNPAGHSLSRSVVIEARNNDRYGRATELVTSTQFPAGTQLTNLSAGCYFAGFTVDCNHGILQAGSIHTASVTATLQAYSTADIIADIDLVNASDSKTQNNRAAIQLLQIDNATSDAIPASSQLVSFDDGARETTPASANAGLARTGTVSIGLLVLLQLIFVQKLLTASYYPSRSERTN